MTFIGYFDFLTLHTKFKEFNEKKKLGNPNNL